MPFRRERALPARVRGPVAEANPWHARTLEWQTTSPPPLHNFENDPVITGGPYDYGVPNATAHNRFAGAPLPGEAGE